MSKRNDLDYIADILEALKRIFSYCDNLNYDQFLDDEKTQDAVVRNLEIIGEASKNISSVFSQKYSEVTWSDLAKVRDKLIHHYFGVNIDIVWSIIESSLPKLQNQLKEIYDREIC